MGPEVIATVSRSGNKLKVQTRSGQVNSPLAIPGEAFRTDPSWPSHLQVRGSTGLGYAPLQSGSLAEDPDLAIQISTVNLPDGVVGPGFYLLVAEPMHGQGGKVVGVVDVVDVVGAGRFTVNLPVNRRLLGAHLELLSPPTGAVRDIYLLELGDTVAFDLWEGALGPLLEDEIHAGWHTVWTDPKLTVLAFYVYVVANGSATFYFYQGTSLTASAGAPLYWQVGVSGSMPAGFTKVSYPTPPPAVYTTPAINYWFSLNDPYKGSVVAVIGQDQKAEPTYQIWLMNGGTNGKGGWTAINDTATGSDTVLFTAITEADAKKLLVGFPSTTETIFYPIKME